MEVKDSIVDLPVQDPPSEIFSASDITWTKFGTTEHHVDDVALIPYSRVDAFITGECSNVECPTRFHIERGRKRSRGSLKEYKSDDYLIYRLYWCSFGPENYGEGGSILPSRRYRLNTRNRAARPQSMRGCTCHFAVKRLYARPAVAMLIYHERRHINKSGFVCHGPLDRDAIGPGAKKIPYVGNEVQQQTMSLIYLGIPVENVLQTHIEGVQRYCGPNAGDNASQYVQKLEMIIKRSTHELDLDDQASIRMWVEKNKKSVFFYQDSSDTDPFILGIQTEWQLQQMVRFGHQSLLAVDSSFGISKLKYPLYTLLAFDSRQHALPVAWVITRTGTRQDVSKWMKALVDRIHTTDSGWRISGFIIDDAALEINPIRDTFGCPILFCLWRIRRSWQRNVIKRCSNAEVQREMFKQLGNFLYSVWGKEDYVGALGEFLQDFIDQTDFMQYFRECWVPKLGSLFLSVSHTHIHMHTQKFGSVGDICMCGMCWCMHVYVLCFMCLSLPAHLFVFGFMLEMWLVGIKDLPLASQEAGGAIEAYHVKLKSKLYDDSHLGALQRVDWLVHKLTTELHSSYWLDRYADESGSFETVKEEYISSTSWQRALQIPDDAVIFDDKQKLFAKVLSQKDSIQTRTVWNPGSEFALCDCSWSTQGNVCKHTIKVNMACSNCNDYLPSMSSQSFRQILDDLWRKPMDDSIELDQSMAWTNQVREKIQILVELSHSENIGNVINNLPLKWVTKKGRTFIGKPSLNFLALLPSSKDKNTAVMNRKRKRKRLSRIKGPA